MIRLARIAKSYGPQTLFENLSLHIKEGVRIGLVGDNGAGKSTLLKIISGEIAPDDGERTIRNNLVIGYLRQEAGAGGDSRSLLDSVLEARSDLRLLEREIEALSAALSTVSAEESERLALKLAQVQEEFQERGGYTHEATGRAVLAGLGFRPEQFGEPLNLFSGGWRMRAELARMLSQKPHLMLLDEPTNHLDIESTLWLENFLANRFEGSLILISHDRYFLERLTNTIADVEHGALKLYPCSYHHFVEKKEAEAALLQKQALNQQKEIAHQEKFIERFRAKNTKATAVQSRIKALAKIERIELKKERKGIGFRFREAARINQSAVRLEGVCKTYGAKVIYDNLDFNLQRGERVALVGPNGAGKTTLLNIITGATSIEGGNVTKGPSVKAQTFAQFQVEALDLNKTVIEEVIADIPFAMIPRARTLLGSFLFRKDDVDKKIAVLSGGEKSRVALAKIALCETNLLLLDEPTNHLDLKSRQALESALASYSGCLVMISHDRAFIESVANMIVHVEGGQLTIYHGSWSYYEKKRAEEKERREKKQGAPTTESPLNKKEARRLAAKAREEANKKLGPHKKRMNAIEKNIEKAEKMIAETEAALQNPDIYRDSAKGADFGKTLATAKKEYASLLRKWETTAAAIEELEEKL